MPHIHDKIDFTASAYIVYDNKVLLIHHKNLDMWLQIGGHIELDEDPDQAVMREVAEECGLDVELLSERPEGYDSPGLRVLHRPDGVNIHKYGKSDHQHVDLVYFAKAKDGQVTLEVDAHNEIRWFSLDELEDPYYDIQPLIKYNAQQAIKRAAQ